MASAGFLPKIRKFLTPMRSFLTHSTFGWPLVIAGATKITYDLLLLSLYRHVPEAPGGERQRRATSSTPPNP